MKKRSKRTRAAMRRRPAPELKAFRDSATQEPLAMAKRAGGMSFALPGPTAMEVSDGVATIQIRGPLDHRAGGYWQSYEEIEASIVGALKDSEVTKVILDIGSPGGVVAGLLECYLAIVRAKKKYGKMVVAYLRDEGLSAAYWLACACDEIWMPATGEAGSIGIILEMDDVTEAMAKQGVRRVLVATGDRKADWHSDRPLTDEILRVAQLQVDYLGSIFFGVAAKSRDLEIDAVRDMQAAIFVGPSAVTAGLVDGISSWAKFNDIVRQVKTDTVAQSPTPEEAKANAMKKKLLALTKAKTEAAQALAAAKTTEAKKAALASFEKATAELAIASFKPSAKVRAAEAEDEDSEDDEESDDEAEAEDEEAEDEEESDEEAEAEDGDEEDDEEDSSDGGEEASGKDAKAFRGKTGLYTSDRLLRLARQVTGKKGLREVFGALDGIGERLAHADKVEARVAKLETSNRESRVTALIAKAKADGKLVGKARVAAAHADGMKFGTKWLKAHIGALPKLATRNGSGGFVPRENADGDPAALTKDQEAMLKAASAGLSPDAAEAMKLAVAKTASGGKKLPRT